MGNGDGDAGETSSDEGMSGGPTERTSNPPATVSIYTEPWRRPPVPPTAIPITVNVPSLTWKYPSRHRLPMSSLAPPATSLQSSVRRSVNPRDQS